MTQQNPNTQAAQSGQRDGKTERKLIAISSGKGGVG
ncbi:MAG: ATP-binding protein involved in chromosome partitioning, partial [Lentimonas sp.]